MLRAFTKVGVYQQLLGIVLEKKTLAGYFEIGHIGEMSGRIGHIDQFLLLGAKCLSKMVKK